MIRTKSLQDSDLFNPNITKSGPKIKSISVKEKNLITQADNDWFAQARKCKPKFTLLNDQSSGNEYTGNITWLSWSARESKNPKNLQIDFSGCKHISDANIRPLLVKIPFDNAKSLANLTIDLSNCPTLTTSSVKLIFSLLKHTTSLKYFAFNFEENVKFTSSGLESLSIFLKNLKFLKTFHFGPKTIKKQAPTQTMTTLFRPRVTSLLDISVGAQDNFYRGFRVDDNVVNTLSSTIKHLTSLTSLTINLLNSKVTDKGLASLSESLSSLKSLESLSLILSPCPITDLGLQAIGSALKSLKSLIKLELEFGFCTQIKFSGMIVLLGFLQEMKSLTHLAISFNGCNITTPSIEPLCTVLRNMKGLKSLILDFGDFNINSKGETVREATEHISSKRLRGVF